MFCHKLAMNIMFLSVSLMLEWKTITFSSRATKQQGLKISWDETDANLIFRSDKSITLTAPHRTIILSAHLNSWLRQSLFLHESLLSKLMRIKISGHEGKAFLALVDLLWPQQLYPVWNQDITGLLLQGGHQYYQRHLPAELVLQETIAMYHFIVDKLEDNLGVTVIASREKKILKKPTT